METITINDEFNKIKTQLLFHRDYNKDNDQTVDITVDTDAVTEVFAYSLLGNITCTDTTERLETVLQIFKRTCRFYINKYYESAEVTAILSIAEYDLELFGAEAYNGFDYDGLMELEDITYDEAVMQMLLFCIGRIQLELHMRK